MTKILDWIQVSGQPTEYHNADYTYRLGLFDALVIFADYFFCEDDSAVLDIISHYRILIVNVNITHKDAREYQLEGIKKLKDLFVMRYKHRDNIKWRNIK